MEADKERNLFYEHLGINVHSTTIKLLLDVAAKQEVMWRILMQMRSEQNNEPEDEYTVRMINLYGEIREKMIEDLPKVLK